MATYATGLLLDRYSVATALGTPPEQDNASSYDAALRLLTSHEATMYSAWTKSPQSILPSPDWRRLSLQITGSPANMRRWRNFIPALSALYSTSHLAAENCKAWAEKHPDLMPLLVAARKMEHAKRIAKYVGSSRGSRAYFLELLACKKVMCEIGAQRVKSSIRMKEINKFAAEKEQELSRRVAKLNAAELPSSRDSAAKMSEIRDATYAKLAKTRTNRIRDGSMVKKQNVELTALEVALRRRIDALEERLESSPKKSSAPSSSSSRTSSRGRLRR